MEFGSDGSSHSLNSVPILPQPHQFLAFFCLESLSILYFPISLEGVALGSFCWAICGRDGVYLVETEILGMFSLCKSGMGCNK
ncbi:hypothetical protein GBA52_006444 [Prunus armeniaca]|nr:hypothetical protein GBA52_006335 [Prunus armeniaca]KAH0979267.1 hypothetical protein GBA52_006444 [Prunus armeniaca]